MLDRILLLFLRASKRSTVNLTVAMWQAALNRTTYCFIIVLTSMAADLTPGGGVAREASVLDLANGLSL